MAGVMPSIRQRRLGRAALTYCAAYAIGVFLYRTTYVPGASRSLSGYVIAGAVLFAPAMIAALLLLRRPAIPPGHCLRCSYDLTGNVSGVCPECGEPAR